MITKKLKEEILREVRDAIRAATMEGAGFNALGDSEYHLPKDEEEVNAFIKNRTKLYRQSWIIGPLERVVKHLEAGK